jgi:hypothetical protein
MLTDAARSNRTRISEFADIGDARAYSSVVSVHAHSHHSRESLTDVPDYISRVPLVGRRFLRELRACLDREGCPADYTNVWWHPPVSPRDLFESEIRHIEDRFALDGIVSITDHDNIAGGVELRQLFAERRAPIALEWTLPFAGTFFHLGVHNLPAVDASAWFTRLLQIATNPTDDAVGDALHDLHGMREALIVFNHPLWDLAGAGEQHLPLVRSFLERYGACVHALEMNGYRSWNENQQVGRLSEACGLPIIFATSFAEFAAEIRRGLSHVVVMPEYRTSLSSRILASASDVLRARRARSCQERWTDRISWDTGNHVRTLSSLWPNGGSLWVRSAVATFSVLSHPLVLPMTGSALLAAEGALARSASMAGEPPAGPRTGVAEPLPSPDGAR